MTVAITGGFAGWATHAHLYTGVSQSGPTDWGIDETSAVVATVTVGGIDVPANGLVVMGAGHGDSDAISSWTLPLTQRQNGPHPSSAILAEASGIESTAQTDKTYEATFVGSWNRGTGIVGVWPIGTDVSVSTTGSQTASLLIPSTDQNVGDANGKFVITENTSSRNVTGITITENGTVDAALNLDNIKLFYDLDATTPYDCASESYAGGDSQFGATDTDGFSAANGTSAFTGTVAVSTTQSMCVYVVLDVLSGAVDNQTLEIEITSPSTQVTVDGSGTVSPSSALALSGTTNLDTPPDLQQIHYRWRNDDGGEASPLFDSDAALCLVNNGGPFAQAGNTYNTTGTAYNIWTDGTYIYAADGASGLHAFTFDGTNFTLINTYDSDGEAFDVWGDGTYNLSCGRIGWY